MRLNAKTVAMLTLPAGKTDHIEWDDQVRGFGYRLRAARAGAQIRKSWVVQYKRAGATRRMLLGQAAVLGAEQARLQARAVLGKVAQGEDPASDRRDRRDRDQNTMRALVAEYLAAKQSEVRPKTFTGMERYLTGKYFKPLHGMPVDTIGRRDVARRIVVISRESGNATAREARGALSTFFVWCLHMGLAEQNPVAGAVRPAEIKPRERVLKDNELAAIWRACGDDEYGKIIRLLVLTGCRRAEIGDMCWSEIDLDKGVWVLPSARSKNGRTHTLPLMPMARAILYTVPRMATRGQLFGQRSHGFTNWTLPKPVLDERSGVTNWVVHDIRRSVSTGMADIGVLPHIIEATLNHYSGHRGGISGVYNRAVYPRDVRAALAMWERYLGLVLDRDLYAAHQAFLSQGDEQAREKAGKAFHDAIAAGGGFWADYLRTLLAGGERKVLAYPGAAVGGA
jgi:integrase